MSFGTRLKEKREALGITQPQLAEMLNVSKGAIGNWETDVNSPRATLLYDLFDILHCDANYLFQDETRELYKNEASPEEFENIIKKYRLIAEYSPDGASVVDTVLAREYAIADKLKTQKDIKPENRPTSPTAQIIPMRFLSYYQRMASAGRGEYLFSDIPTEVIPVPDTPLSRRADFVIGVSGRSMENTYFDGDKVLVEKAQDVPLGKIGIFIRGDECFIKEAGIDRLISHNEDKEQYPDILPDERRIDTIGIVLGKVGE